MPNNPFTKCNTASAPCESPDKAHSDDDTIILDIEEEEVESDIEITRDIINISNDETDDVILVEVRPLARATRSQIRSTKPVGLLPDRLVGQQNRRKQLPRTKRYSFPLLPRRGRREFWDPSKGHIACWLEDDFTDEGPRRPIAPFTRFRDPEGLPRWFGPLKNAVLCSNNGLLPRNSTEFFRLVFRPAMPGDHEVWLKYRELEEEIYIKYWDTRKGFKNFIGDLNSFLFGHKGESDDKIELMDIAMHQFGKDLLRPPEVPRNYYMWATDEAVILRWRRRVKEQSSLLHNDVVSATDRGIAKE